MKRNALGTDSAALAAVGTPSCHMEGTDNMEHLLLKGIGIRLLIAVILAAVEDTFAAAAGRTHIAAGVAADTFGKLLLPEMKTLLRTHGLQLLHFLEAVAHRG